MTGRIEIFYDDMAPHDSIDVAGEFTNWIPVPLGLDYGTKYGAIFDGAEAGHKYMYKFIVDGEWRLLQGPPLETDPIGNLNHYITAIPVPDAEESVSGAGTDAEKSAPEPYEMTGSQLPHATETVPELAAVGATGATGAGIAGAAGTGATKSAPEPYELNSTELPHATETVTGLDTINTAAKTAPEPYELNSSQLPHATETVSGLDTVNTGMPKSETTETVPGLSKVSESETSELGNSLTMPGSAPYEVNDPELNPAKNPDSEFTNSLNDRNLNPYELKEGQLSHPIDKVDDVPDSQTDENLDPYELKEGQLSHPVEKVGGLSEFQQTEQQTKNLDPYELKEGQLSHSVEKVGGLSEFQQTEQQTKNLHPYELEEGQLSHPVEKVGGLSQFQAEQNDLDSYEYKEGQLAHPVDKVGTLGLNESTGATPELYEYKESQLSDPVDVVPQTEEDYADTYRDQSYQDALDSPSGPPVVPTAIPAYGTPQRPSSDLDFAASQRAVHDVHADDDPASYGFAPEKTSVLRSTTSTPSSKHTHQAIDVSTGFPVDQPTTEVPSPSRQTHHHLGGVPTLRSDARHRGGQPVPGSTGSSTEHRQAAVVAAAAKASAFAKQDVANIGGDEPAREPIRKQRPMSSSAFSHGSHHAAAESRPTNTSTGGVPTTTSAGLDSTGAAAGTGSGTASLAHQSSFEREARSELDRRGSKRGGGAKLKRFFSKLGK